MSGSAAASGPTDEDNISVTTNNIENRTITNGNDVREYVVKFQFKPSASGNNTEVAKTHFAILQAINDIYPEVTIYDNYGNTLSNPLSLKRYDAYLRHFKLQFVRANEQKKRQSLYLAFHRIRSAVPITEIRRHSTIAHLLLKVNTRLTVHLWNEEETRISTLGFHVGVDPSNHLKDHFEERIRSQISSATGRAKKHISCFQCGFTSPFCIDSAGHRTATKSYDIQCRQKDAKELVHLLRQTYQKNPSFVFHKLRHSDPYTYKQAIRSQNCFLSKSRVVPIQGIDEDLMFYLEQDLLQVAGVHAILHHRDTASKGRWSILTTEAHFRTLTNTIRENLPRWAEYYANDVQMSTDLPPVGLAFKNSSADSNSDQSFETYASACSSVYTLQDDTYDDPPANAGPVPQAWDNIPSCVRSATASSVPSGVSQDEFDRVSLENARLSRRVDDLMAQVQSLLSRLPPDQPTASATSSSFVSPADIQQIIATTTQAVIRQLHQHTAQESAPAQDGNMSFDSTTDHHHE
ncbi:hypothetical protein ACA910_007426 [Epithemia clementina (nom. ined.)]